MKKLLTTTVCGLVVASILFGCGDNNNNTQKGTLVDSKLFGVSYSCDISSSDGKTDENGTFIYDVGDTCKFSLGKLDLGSVKMSKENVVITPLDLVGTTDINNSEVVAMAVLFQSLDIDRNPNNGINLSHVENVFDANETFQAVSDDIAGFLRGEFDDNITIVSHETARNHLATTLATYNIGNTPTNSVLTCDTSKFAPNAPVATPTSMDFISFAMVYVADEGTYDDNFNFTANAQVMITLDVTGKLTYGTSVYPTTSACIETLQGGAKQFVLHTAKGHLDFRSDKISVSGISPLNGTTIVKANAQDSSGDDDNTTTGGETGKGITLSKSIGGISTLASTLAANPAKGKAEWGNALESIYVYMTNSGGMLTIGMAKVGSATLSTWVNNTSAGVCTLEESSLSKYYKLCSSLGIDYNQTAGTVTFNNTEMIDKVGPHGTFTVSGSLSFKPN